MPIDFPSNPQVNDIITDGATTWIWSGSFWDIRPTTSPTFTGITADSLTADEITVTDIDITNLTVTGTVTGIDTELTLDELTDVNASSPTNGQVLSYNSSTTTWSPVTLSSTFTGGTVPNPINITSVSNSSSTSTGSLVSSGGIGLAGNAYVGGHLAVFNNYIDLKARSEIRFSDTDSSNYVGFRGASTIASNVVWTLPSADGSVGQVLQTNGAGTLAWANVSGSGSGGTVAGTDTQIQYNDNNAFGASASFTYNSDTNTMTVVNVSSSGTIIATNNTASTNSTTGAVTVTGGVGIGGQLNVAGTVNKFTSSQASSSTTTGAVVVTGGVGVGGGMYVGGNINATTAPTDSDHVTNKSYVDSNILAFSMAFGV